MVFELSINVCGVWDTTKVRVESTEQTYIVSKIDEAISNGIGLTFNTEFGNTLVVSHHVLSTSIIFVRAVNDE